MKDKTITELLRDHQKEIEKLIDEFENDHSKVVLLKKHLDMHHQMIDRLMQNLMLNVLMSELSEYVAGPEVWKEKLKILREVVDHHHREEREGILPHARKLLSTDKQKELALQFAVVKSHKLNVKKTG